MKNNSNMTFRLSGWILAAVAPVLFFSCTGENLQEPETQLPDDCYGVYFLEETDNVGEVEVSPTGDKTLTFTLLRQKDDEKITVPVNMTSNHEGIFSVSEAVFEQGQTEIELTVSFPDVVKGTEYTCRLSIDDPKYAMKYGKYPTSAEFTVTVVQWNPLQGSGKWRDDLISSMYANVTNPYAERDIVMYERDDRPGYYRIEHVYTKEYLATLFYGDESYASAIPACTETYTYVDATNPEKVWLPYQSTGVLLSQADGELSIASDVPELFGEQSAGVYGKLENGVITFPQFAVLANFSMEPSSWYSSNAAGNLRIVLPGYRVYDYSVTLAAGQTNQSTGLLPVYFVFGRDIRNVKYDIYEGTLTETSVASLSETIYSDPDCPRIAESQQLGVAPESGKTGEYTLVTANIDRTGAYRGYSYVSFSYESPDDPVEVVLNTGLIVSDKYAPKGYTKENSVEFYISGKGIEELRMILVKTSDIEDMTPSEVAEQMQSNITPVTSAQLDSINTTGYSGIVGTLVAGTEYGLYVLATNGYRTVIIPATAFTEGTPDPMDVEYTMADMLPQQPESVSEYFKEWDYYAVSGFDDLLGSNAKRSRVGTVTVSDSETPDADGFDYVLFKGLFGEASTNYGVQESVEMVYYGGYFFNLALLLDEVNVNGQMVYPIMASVTKNGGMSVGDMTLMGGMVEDGLLAFVDAGSLQGETFDGIFVMGFKDPSLTTPIGGLAYYKDILLVDPQVSESDGESSGTAVTSGGMVPAESLRSVLKGYFGSGMNCVETPEGRIKSIVDSLSGRKFRNYMNVSMTVPYSPEPVKVKFRQEPVRTTQSLQSPEKKGGLHSREMVIE